MGRSKFTSRAEVEAAHAAAASKKSLTGSGKTTTIVASSVKHRGGEIVSLENERRSKKVSALTHCQNTKGLLESSDISRTGLVPFEMTMTNRRMARSPPILHQMLLFM